jgi:hypothetical protein
LSPVVRLVKRKGKRQLYTKGETINKTQKTQNRKHIQYKKTNIQTILHTM